MISSTVSIGRVAHLPELLSFWVDNVCKQRLSALVASRSMVCFGDSGYLEVSRQKRRGTLTLLLAYFLPRSYGGLLVFEGQTATNAGSDFSLNICGSWKIHLEVVKRD